MQHVNFIRVSGWMGGSDIIRPHYSRTAPPPALHTAAIIVANSIIPVITTTQQASPGTFTNIERIAASLPTTRPGRFTISTFSTVPPQPTAAHCRLSCLPLLERHSSQYNQAPFPLFCARHRPPPYGSPFLYLSLLERAVSGWA